MKYVWFGLLFVGTASNMVLCIAHALQKDYTAATFYLLVTACLYKLPDE